MSIAESELLPASSLFEDVSGWIDAAGWKRRREPSDSSAIDRIVFTPETTEPPSMTFVFDAIPPLREGGSWIADLTLLSTLESLMLSETSGTWFAHIQKPGGLRNEAVRVQLTQERFLQEVERMSGSA